MTITQLMYFAAVAEDLNITRVAERYHVSQPAVSAAVRDLEKEYNIVLFERRRNELFLTPQGREAYRRAKSLLEHYEAFGQRMKDAGKKQSVSLAIAPNVSALYLADLFPHIREALPDALISMQENSIANMTDMLKNGEIDAGFFSCLRDRMDPALHYLRIGSFTLALCAAPGVLHTSTRRAEPRILDGVPLVFQFRGSQLNARVVEYLSKYDIVPNVIFFANQLTTISSFVRKGLAAGFLPPELVEKEQGILVYDLPDFTEQNLTPLYFVYKRKSETVGILEKVFRDFFAERNAV